jgi:hypothetical protein
VGARSGGSEVVGVAVGFMVCIFPFLPIVIIAMLIFIPFIIPLVATGGGMGEDGAFGRVGTTTAVGSDFAGAMAGAMPGAMGEVGAIGRVGVTTTDGWDIGSAIAGAVGDAGADGSGNAAGGSMGVEMGIGSFLCGGTAGISIGV